MIGLGILTILVGFLAGLVTGIYISHRGVIKPHLTKFFEWLQEDVTVERLERPMATRRDTDNKE